MHRAQVVCTFVKSPFMLNEINRILVFGYSFCDLFMVKAGFVYRIFLATGLLLICLQTGVPKNLSEKYNKMNENREKVIFLKVSHRQSVVNEIK